MNFFATITNFLITPVAAILIVGAICFILLAKESKYYRIIGWLTILFFIISPIIIILCMKWIGIHPIFSHLTEIFG